MKRYIFLNVKCTEFIEITSSSLFSKIGSYWKSGWQFRIGKIGIIGSASVSFPIGLNSVGRAVNICRQNRGLGKIGESENRGLGKIGDSAKSGNRQNRQIGESAKTGNRKIGAADKIGSLGKSASDRGSLKFLFSDRQSVGKTEIFAKIAQNLRELRSYFFSSRSELWEITRLFMFLHRRKK